MKLVLLAAGRGERMMPLTLSVPKPLIVYRGKTALDHLFGALPDLIDEVVITVGYLGERIRSHCGNSFYGRKVHYIEGDIRGNALGFIKSQPLINSGERFAVSYADDVLTSKEMVDCLNQEFSWLCYHVANPKNVGVVEIDRGSNISKFIEKPENPISTLVANGFMVVNSDIYSYKPVIHDKGEYYFADLMAKFCSQHKVRAVIGDHKHSQLTSPEDVKRLNEAL